MGVSSESNTPIESDNLSLENPKNAHQVISVEQPCTNPHTGDDRTKRSVYFERWVINTGTGPNGLEWLDLTQTTGQSYNAVAGGFNNFIGGTLGFSFATQAQVNQLFTNAGAIGSFSPSLGIPVQTLIGLIGCTQSCTTTTGTSRGIIDLDFFSSTTKGIGQIDFVTQGVDLAGIGSVSGGVINDNFSDSTVGSFLVRQASPVSAVPVPAALPLFGTGLAIMGFIGWRRKRKPAATA